MLNFDFEISKFLVIGTIIKNYFNGYNKSTGNESHGYSGNRYLMLPQIFIERNEESDDEDI